MPAAGSRPADADTVAAAAATLAPASADGASRRSALVERHRELLGWIVVVALIVRGLLSLADAIAIAQGGVRWFPIGQAVALGSPSLLWAGLLSLLSFAGAAGLALHRSLGWLLAVAACVAYVISGISDMGMIEVAALVGSPGFWIFFVSDLIVPLGCLALLAALRRPYLTVRVRPLPARSGMRLVRRSRR